MMLYETFDRYSSADQEYKRLFYLFVDLALVDVLSI